MFSPIMKEDSLQSKSFLSEMDLDPRLPGCELRSFVKFSWLGMRRATDILF